MTALCACPIPAELGNYKISSYTAGYGQCFAFFFFFLLFYTPSRRKRTFCNCSLSECFFFNADSSSVMHRPADRIDAACAALSFKPSRIKTAYWGPTPSAPCLILLYSEMWTEAEKALLVSVAVTACCCVCWSSADAEHHLRQNFLIFPCPNSLKYNYVVALKAGTLAQTLQKI